MSYEPQTLRDAMNIWKSHGGQDDGIVGDAAHQQKQSYHNGWDVASRLWGSTDLAEVSAKDYSYRQARDRVKSNGAMAMDLGSLNGGLTGLQAFSRWLVDRCVNGM